MKKVLFIILMLTCAMSCSSDKKERVYKGGVLISAGNPKAEIKAADEFIYIGTRGLPIKGIAYAERHHWVVADENKRVKKMFVVQFEGFLDGVDQQYGFSIPSSERSGGNYKFTDEPISLSGKEFIHNTWAFDNGASARDNPGLEAAATLSILDATGYSLDDEVIMSRFARAIGNDRRHELLLFYFEPLADSGWVISDFPEEDGLTNAFETYSDAVRARSLESFDINFQE